MAANGGIWETCNRQSEEIMEPEAFFPVAKDPTTVRAAQLAVLELLKQPEEEMYHSSSHFPVSLIEKEE